jgi:uncharacterized membrane protein
MHLTIETDLDRRRDQVWRAFHNFENLKKWQPALLSFEPISGQPGHVGAVSRLKYDENGRVLVLTETITRRREPEEFAGSYETPHVTNSVYNRFVDLRNERTRWIIEAEFHFHGLSRFVSPLLRKAIRQRFHEDAQRFKAKLESGELES